MPATLDATDVKIRAAPEIVEYRLAYGNCMWAPSGLLALCPEEQLRVDLSIFEASMDQSG